MTLNEIDELYKDKGLDAMAALPEPDFMKWAASIIAETEQLRAQASYLHNKADRTLFDLSSVMRQRQYAIEGGILTDRIRPQTLTRRNNVD